MPTNHNERWRNRNWIRQYGGDAVTDPATVYRLSEKIAGTDTEQAAQIARDGIITGAQCRKIVAALRTSGL